MHGSVSLLIDEASDATASYGYRPYGGANDALTAGDFDPSDQSEATEREDNPLNAFRYSGRRLDTGSGSIDMGARRYGPDTARFLQRDFLSSAVGDLGLSLDPLTRGRYNFAGGNPISYVEWDGHVFYVDGDGGGVEMPSRDDREEPEPDAPVGSETTTDPSSEGARFGQTIAWTYTGVLAAPPEIFAAFRWWTSTLGRTLATSDDAAKRSAAARLLPLAGRFTSTPTAVFLRRLTGAVPAVGGVVSLGANLLEGQDPEEAAFKATVETASGFGLATAAGLATCGIAAVATLGVGGAICAGAVFGGGVVGAIGGDALGDWAYEQPIVRDVVESAGEAVHGALDFVTFWDN